MSSGKAGRPNRREAREREQRFVELLAEGKTPREAGREARIDPWRAFKLASSGDFWQRVYEARRQADT